MRTFDVTLTDTYGGEANYSWVHRAVIKTKDDITAKGIGTQARAAVGMTGVRSSMFVDFGDMIQIEFKKNNVILFITPQTTTEENS